MRLYWCALPFSSPESSLLLRACYLSDVSLPSKLYSSPALTCTSGMPKVATRLTGTHSKLSSKFSSLSNDLVTLPQVPFPVNRLYSRETKPPHTTPTPSYTTWDFQPHTSVYVNLTILLKFYRIIYACVNSVYQAVFFLPRKKWPGNEATVNRT